MIAGRVKATDAKRDFFLYSRESIDNSLIYVRTLRCADLSQCDLSGPTRQVCAWRLSSFIEISRCQRALDVSHDTWRTTSSEISDRIYLQRPKVILSVISKTGLPRKCFEAHPSLTNLPWIGSRALNNTLRASIITPHSPKQKVLVI